MNTFMINSDITWQQPQVADRVIMPDVNVT